MNALGILGGVGLGITRGAEDWRRADEEARRARMFARQEKEWADADALQAELKGVRPEGDYTETTYGAPGEAEMPTQRTVKRTAGDVARDTGAIYTRHGKPEVGAQFSDRAYARDKQAKADETLKTVSELRRLAVTDPTAFFAHPKVREMYAQWPDGKDFTLNTLHPSGPMLNMVDQKGNRVVQQVPITAQLSAQAARAITGAMLGEHDIATAAKMLELEDTGAYRQQQIGVENQRTGLMERELTEYKLPLLSAQAQHMGYQNKALEAQASLHNRTDPNLRVGAELKLTPEEQSQMAQLYQAFTLAKTPQERAAAQQNLQNFSATVMIRKGRMPTLPDLGKRVDPAARLSAITSLMDKGGLSFAEASMTVDRELGGTPLDLSSIVPGLQALNDGKKPTGVAKPSAPVPAGIYRDSSMPVSEALSAAARGDAIARGLLQDKLQANELTMQERVQAERILGIRK